MGFLSKLFGQTEKKSPDSLVNQELRLEFNIMKNISLEKCLRHNDTSKYKLIEDGIYEDLNDDSEQKYRMIISYELESHENGNQYPLDDVLDKYLLHVVSEDFLEFESDSNPNKYTLELGGFFDGMKEAKEKKKKKVFNREFKDEEGHIRVKLVID